MEIDEHDASLARAASPGGDSLTVSLESCAVTRGLSPGTRGAEPPEDPPKSKELPGLGHFDAFGGSRGATPPESSIAGLREECLVGAVNSDCVRSSDAHVPQASQMCEGRSFKWRRRCRMSSACCG